MIAETSAGDAEMAPNRRLRWQKRYDVLCRAPVIPGC
jgi:hypothetical protein